MKDLLLNTLIAWQSTDGGRQGTLIERIIWIDPQRIHLVMIEIYGKTSLPVVRLYNDVAKALESNEAYIFKDDPFTSLRRPESKIKDSHKRIRDRAWERIAPLVKDVDFYFLIDPDVRGRLVNERIESGHGSIATIYKDIRHYWQRGLTKNALLPDFDNCGAPGRRRLSEDQNAPKLGRKPATANNTRGGEGIRITPEIEKRFENGTKKFFETAEKRSLSDAFDLILIKFFWVVMELRNGVLTPILPPAEELPTFEQYRYWYEKIYRDKRRESKKREGEREYLLRCREMLGDSTQMSFGPGAIYQIDATPGDIYLVSSFDRTRIIGRPVVYFCTDVFSRLITGLCVTLEGPSWKSAMLAIDNVVADKVEFCAEFGIEIEESDWPSHHLPGAFLADRGEFLGYDADSLPNALGTPIHNTGSYRADWKGIVERLIGLAQTGVVRFTPGAVIKRRGRGDPDYRLDAALTLDDLRKLLIIYALDYNANHYLKLYRKDEFMIADHVPRYALDIWDWGISNGFSHLHSLSRDVVRHNLLPRRMVSVTARGIHLEGALYYTCDLAILEGWFTGARVSGNRRIEVCVDPRSADTIYLPLDGGHALEPCHLTDASKHLLGHDLYDVTDYFALEKHAQRNARTQIQQSKAAFHAQKDHIISQAVEKTQAARAAIGKQSKAERTRGIRDNRNAEKIFEREKSIQQSGPKNPGASDALSGIKNTGVVVPEVEPEGYVPRISNVSRIRDLRDEEWRKKGDR